MFTPVRAGELAITSGKPGAWQGAQSLYAMGDVGYSAEVWYVPSQKLTFVSLANGDKYLNKSGAAYVVFIHKVLQALETGRR